MVEGFYIDTAHPLSHSFSQPTLPQRVPGWHKVGGCRPPCIYISLGFPSSMLWLTFQMHAILTILTECLAMLVARSILATNIAIGFWSLPRAAGFDIIDRCLRAITWILLSVTVKKRSSSAVSWTKMVSRMPNTRNTCELGMVGAQPSTVSNISPRSAVCGQTSTHFPTHHSALVEQPIPELQQSISNGLFNIYKFRIEQHGSKLLSNEQLSSR